MLDLWLYATIESRNIQHYDVLCILVLNNPTNVFHRTQNNCTPWCNLGTPWYNTVLAKSSDTYDRGKAGECCILWLCIQHRQVSFGYTEDSYHLQFQSHWSADEDIDLYICLTSPWSIHISCSAWTWWFQKERIIFISIGKLRRNHAENLFCLHQPNKKMCFHPFSATMVLGICVTESSQLLL